MKLNPNYDQSIEFSCYRIENNFEEHFKFIVIL